MENDTQNASYTSGFEKFFQKLLQKALGGCKNEEEQGKLIAKL